MSQSIWNASGRHTGVRRYGITILGIVIGLALISTVAGLYLLNATATAPSIAEARVRSWVSQLGDAQLTPARHLAQQHLEQAGEASVDPLIAALHSSDSTMRRNSAEMLGFIASPHALEALTGALANDPVPSVRSRAAWALGELHDSRAVNALASASVLDQDLRVRQEASASLDALRTNFALIAGKNERLTSAFAVAPGHPGAIYLAEMNQVSISRDDGTTWSPTGGSLPSRVSALAVNPSNVNIVYAGTESMGLYESTDGGTTWRARNQGLGLNSGERLTVTAIAIDPQAQDHVYVATGEWVGVTQVTLTPVGVLSTFNGGDAWERVNLLVGHAAITRLLVLGNTLYASAGNEVSSLPL